jgi:hypothetical protein
MAVTGGKMLLTGRLRRIREPDLTEQALGFPIPSTEKHLLGLLRGKGRSTA